ncbi:rhomboid family intramembrane serine protease [Oceanidesulfovibrio indonesiensis]|uniref:Rhomboid family intramembrane serine protease n=1 Tax=Oceanidesulfovibrio indonesiensis TaxID=54767 RepID=A0A7M3MDC8_9BACT|nr:rhomboid family intramembrane serine protease [Oceanidesulfovibrio indonesiensis]TVM16009.1 rhomboid family intramembrane serine protease [Oceanidesulfovibrio indonesiensis]
MFPIRDSIPRIHTPWGVYLIIALNAAVFLFELSLTHEQLFEFVHLYGVVPARYLHAEGTVWEQHPGTILSLFSYMFLHGGWMHFIVNMWTLWIFADNIEDVMGTVRFLIFYLLCGLAALGLHMVFNAQSMMPVLGASGAIAGVMGAYFLLYPHSKVLTLIPIIFIPYFVDLPAVIYLGLWFLIQLSSGISSVGAGESGGIAWWAHAGGFLGGILLLPLFRQSKRCYFCYNSRGRRIGVARWSDH